MEEGLVGIDVPDSVEQRLIQQRGLDRRLSLAKEGDEVFEADGEWFGAGAFVLCVRRYYRESAEAARIDEA